MNINVSELRGILTQIQKQMASRLKSDTVCCGVSTAQYHTLTEIHGQGTCAIKTLAGLMGLDPSSLSRTIDGLVGTGLVSRIENPKDRRCSAISLTGEGVKVVEQINARIDARLETLLKSLPVNEQITVIKTVRQLALIFGQMDGRCCT
ncbi:MAG: MarR family transcriptional regulator [Spirochaetales bacterium]|nr:MarR family transcriptional regulator [Spirochaetales bacterium]